MNFTPLPAATLLTDSSAGESVVARESASPEDIQRCPSLDTSALRMTGSLANWRWPDE
jgi:hypothetical protein